MFRRFVPLKQHPLWRSHYKRHSQVILEQSGREHVVLLRSESWPVLQCFSGFGGIKTRAIKMMSFESFMSVSSSLTSVSAAIKQEPFHSPDGWIWTRVEDSGSFLHFTLVHTADEAAFFTERSKASEPLDLKYYKAFFTKIFLRIY